VLVRILTNDDPAQARRAIELAAGDFVLTATVLVETDWVLASVYRWVRGQRVAGLRILLDMPGAVAIPPHAHWALARMAEGADFADMMHIALAAEADSFATFDRRLTRSAGPDTPVPVETFA
jgi:predicted nucleic-acid-binding protein